MKNYLTLDSITINKSLIGIRVDINSAIINGKVEVSGRMREACTSIQELIKKNATVLIFAHQGRKGKDDFTSLELHKIAMEKILGIEIIMISTLSEEAVKQSLKDNSKHRVFLLENLRELDCEQHPEFTKKQEVKTNPITKIISLCDYYVLDAFSIAHRAHSSIVGAMQVPHIAGRLLQKELKPLSILEQTPHPRIYMMGGVKPDDLLPLIIKSLEQNSVDTILLAGVIGEVALHAKGVHLGKKWDWIVKNEFNKSERELKTLLKKYPNRFILPRDVAYIDSNNERVEVPVEELKTKQLAHEILQDNIIQDIGRETIETFSQYISESQSCYVKGPAGNFEIRGCEVATFELFKHITKSNTFSFMGGGHTLTAAEMSKTISKFSYVSLAGGALVQFLQGKELPGIKALEQSYTLISSSSSQSEYFDIVVIGSNVVDTFINSPIDIDKSILGEKIKIQDNFLTSMGGGGVNTSAIASKLHAKVGLITRVSSESFELLQQSAKEHSFSLINPTPRKENSAKTVLIQTPSHDRVIFTYRGQNQNLSPCDIPTQLPISNYYFSGLTHTSFTTQSQIIKKLNKQQSHSLIAYNPSSYTIQEHEEEIIELLEYIHVLIFNKEEAQALTHQKGINNNLHLLSSMGPKYVVITDGSKGSFAIINNSTHIYTQQSIVNSNNIVDTTGAGDCFAITLFYFLSKQYSLEDAMHYATLNSGHLITQNGSTNGSLTLHELKKKKFKL
ncbi:MAG: phosphoglycerate kinase [Candidatus Nanoarchaeia archaeon]